MGAFTLSDYLKKRGFMCYVSSPSDQDAEGFMKILVKTGNQNLKFKPYVPVCYEKKLSAITSLIIEGSSKKSIYFYDFYKATFFKKDNRAARIKLYGSSLRRNELITEVNKYFSKK